MYDNNITLSSIAPFASLPVEHSEKIVLKYIICRSNLSRHPGARRRPHEDPGKTGRGHGDAPATVTVPFQFIPYPQPRYSTYPDTQHLGGFTVRFDRQVVVAWQESPLQRRKRAIIGFSLSKFTLYFSRPVGRRVVKIANFFLSLFFWFGFSFCVSISVRTFLSYRPFSYTSTVL